MSTLLDTNVVSELMRVSPEHSVARWVSDHRVEDLFLSAVSEAELRYGAAILPFGRRRETLLLKIDVMLSDAFEDRNSPVRRRCRSCPRPHCRRASLGRASRGFGGLPDRGHCGGWPHEARYAQRSRFRGHGDRDRESLGLGVRARS